MSDGKDTSSWAQEVSSVSRNALQYGLQAVQDIVGSPPGPCIIASGKHPLYESLHAAGRDFHVFNTLFRDNGKAEVRNSRMDGSFCTCVLSSSMNASLSAATGGLLHRNADPRHR